MVTVNGHEIHPEAVTALEARGDAGTVVHLTGTTIFLELPIADVKAALFPAS